MLRREQEDEGAEAGAEEELHTSMLPVASQYCTIFSSLGRTRPTFVTMPSMETSWFKWWLRRVLGLSS